VGIEPRMVSSLQLRELGVQTPQLFILGFGKYFHQVYTCTFNSKQKHILTCGNKNDSYCGMARYHQVLI